jgi:hypothetical protein
MPIKYDKSRGKEATSLLAASVVFAFGLFVCVGIGFAFSDRPLVPISAIVGYLMLVIFGLWLSRERRLKNVKLDVSLWRKQDELQDEMPRYEQSHRDRRKQPPTLGSNQPPTAESIRELGTSVNTWVPSERNLREE